MIFPYVKYRNTEIQIHKYTNTQIQHIKSAVKTQHVAYFLNAIANTNIQIQNTQIQRITKCQKHPTCGIFLKRGLFKDMKNYIPKCQTHKYKIHKYTNTACDKVNCFGIYGLHCCWLFAPLTNFIILQCKQCL